MSTPRSFDGALGAPALLPRAAAWLLLRLVVGLPLPGGRFRARLLRLAGMSVGADTWVGSRCTFIGSRMSLGSDCFVNWGVAFDATAQIEIGDCVSLAPGAMLVTATHELGDEARRAGPMSRAPIRIGDGCWIGARATVLPGVTIGAGCVVAAGAVVAHDCEPNGLYAGVPARRVRDLDPRGVCEGAAAGEQTSVEAGQAPASL